MTDTEGAATAPSAPFEPTARWRGNEQVATEEPICATGVKRALTAAARRTVLLADHAEFGRQALYELAPPADFDLAISDEHLPREERDALQFLGLRDQLATERNGRE
ncbi:MULTISPECIES: DeoR/GlpR family DNA-binding transcription regulator [unclassified Streptomyces]|uniref:hypothetical protein n=1 Tax=unclassified Streptomyces TaxID=2593676 RepID=UPI002152655F|nr:hypothetical protein [Streptomyces sp. CB02959]